VRAAFFIVVAAFCGVACRHAAINGRTSFAFVDEVGTLPRPPIDASKMKVMEAISVIVPPKPLGELTPPQYPPAALKVRLQDIALAVTLSIDENGKVVDVQRSIARMASTTAFQEEFLAAAEMAVRAWRFEPAKLAHIEPQPDGRPLVVGTENTSSKLTVAFTFSASGTVTSQPE
jgi:hypothetical protein